MTKPARRDHRTTPRKNPIRTDAERELDRIRKESLRQSKEKRSPLL